MQKDLKMLVYAGIENVAMKNFVAAAGKNHKKKQFKFGEIKTAVAYRPGTRDTVYEVVYVDIIDPMEATSGTVQKTINIKTNNKRVINDVSYEENDNSSGIENNEPNRFRPITNTIKLDSDAISIDGNKQTKKHISNLTNMRDNISQVGVTDNNFLPLWMRTPQLNNIEALGYVPCVVLAYCKEGTSQDILLNIKNNGFNFNSINFEIDRYIIDSTQGNSNEQYIVFANYDFNI